MKPTISLVVSMIFFFSAPIFSQEMATVEPVADVTLYEEDGGIANGAGSFLFVGRTEDRNGAVERRALMRFDIAGTVPAGATVTDVSLEVTMSRTVSGAQTVELRRVTESWGEGSSNAPGQEGGGTDAEAGDATWTHRSLPSSTWSTQGGSFSQTVSASLQMVGNDAYTFAATGQMIADVQGWLDDPASDDGWAMVMPAPPTGSAKRVNSRENGTSSSRPKLTVTYEAAGTDPNLTERYPFPASNASGSGDSFFVTTVDVLNAGAARASFRMQRLERDTDNSSALESMLVSLEPGEVRRFDNVLAEAFGDDGENFAGGAAVLSDSDQLLVMTRTFDNSGEGTKGAALPAVSSADMVAAGRRVTVLFLSEDADFRSNLGFLSDSDFEITVSWELFDSGGNSLATGARVLPPYGVTQINRVMRPFRPIEAGYAEVWTDTSGGVFTTYGAVIDEVSSDPTLVIFR